jgi:hypothetical protein
MLLDPFLCFSFFVLLTIFSLFALFEYSLVRFTAFDLFASIFEPFVDKPAAEVTE